MNEAKLDLQGHMLDDVGYVPEYTLQRSAHTRDVGGVRSLQYEVDIVYGE